MLCVFMDLFYQELLYGFLSLSFSYMLDVYLYTSEVFGGPVIVVQGST
jgi:hypothetical protein